MMLETMAFKSMTGVELFAVGKWNGVDFTKKDLQEIVRAYAALEPVLSVPLKLGHNEEQPLTDGQPAIGWLENVRLSDDGDKVIGDFSDLPDIVHKAMSKKMYRTLSVELAVNVTHKSKKYPYVLTAVALLGSDLPAVNTLSDLDHYIGRAKSSEKIEASNKMIFTSNTGGYTMTIEELQAQLASANAKLVAVEKVNSDLTIENAGLKGQISIFSAEKQQAEAEKRKMEFSTGKATITSDMETLVKAGKITPAQRDTFSARMVEGDMASLAAVQDTVGVLMMGVDKTSFTTGESARNTNDSGEPADKEIFRRISALRSSPAGAHMTFAAAKTQVMAADPQLAKEYIVLTKEI